MIKNIVDVENSDTYNLKSDLYLVTDSAHDTTTFVANLYYKGTDITSSYNGEFCGTGAIIPILLKGGMLRNAQTYLSINGISHCLEIRYANISNTPVSFSSWSWAYLCFYDGETSNRYVTFCSNPYRYGGVLYNPTGYSSYKYGAHYMTTACEMGFTASSIAKNAGLQIGSKSFDIADYLSLVAEEKWMAVSVVGYKLGNKNFGLTDFYIESKSVNNVTLYAWGLNLASDAQSISSEVLYVLWRRVWG